MSSSVLSPRSALRKKKEKVIKQEAREDRKRTKEEIKQAKQVGWYQRWYTVLIITPLVIFYIKLYRRKHGHAWYPYRLLTLRT